MSWTDERVETLKKLWGEGQSASQIAKELGGVTRNAVIGKVHRLGLSNRAGSSAAGHQISAASAGALASASPRQAARRRRSAHSPPTSAISAASPSPRAARGSARLVAGSR